MTSVLLERAAAARPPAPRGLLPVGWPLAVAVAGYPVWWAVGVLPFVLPLTGGVLLWQLARRHSSAAGGDAAGGRAGRLLVPAGFWIWLLFLLVVALSTVMINVRLSGTIPSTGAGRYLAVLFRFLGYASVAVAMLFVLNTSERELPRLRVIRWMSLLGVWTVLLGLVSLALPRGGFRTPFSLLVPTSLQNFAGSRANLAQLQPVLGVDAPRPAAPFVFTNSWGCTLALLLVWMVVLAWAGGRTARTVLPLVMVLSVVPIVYSLNRGMWIGLGLAVVYVAARLAARGRIATMAVLAAVLTVGTVVFVASPLETLVTQRASAGHSNAIRSDLAAQSLRAAKASPLLGLGSTRQVLGSGASIAVGKTPGCPKCGNAEIGSTGQYFLLLVAQGFLGLALYVAYLLRTLWAYRRDASPIGIAGSLVVALTVFFGIAYNGLDVPLLVAFLSIGLLARNALLRAPQPDPEHRDGDRPARTLPVLTPAATP